MRGRRRQNQADGPNYPPIGTTARKSTFIMLPRNELRPITLSLAARINAEVSSEVAMLEGPQCPMFRTKVHLIQTAGVLSWNESETTRSAATSCEPDPWSGAPRSNTIVINMSRRLVHTEAWPTFVNSKRS